MSPEQARRYARQMRLPELGATGQAKLLKAGVLVVGAGGLGSPAAMYLVAAGIGRLGIMDADTLSLPNLQRQILYTTADLGRNKAEAAAERLAAINPGCRLEPRDQMLNAANALSAVTPYNAVVDCTDSFAAKFLIAKTCHETLTPYAHAGILGFTGHAMTVLPSKTACCRCVFDGPLSKMPKTPRRGPLGPVPGIIGAVQAAEIIKLIVGMGALLTNRLLVCDILGMNMRVLPVKHNPNCPLCGKKSTAKSTRIAQRRNAAKCQKDFS